MEVQINCLLICMWEHGFQYKDSINLRMNLCCVMVVPLLNKKNWFVIVEVVGFVF
jgi:hypothetical protein